jgi:hypothetical protein
MVNEHKILLEMFIEHMNNEKKWLNLYNN